MYKKNLFTLFELIRFLGVYSFFKLSNQVASKICICNHLAVLAKSCPSAMFQEYLDKCFMEAFSEEGVRAEKEMRSSAFKGLHEAFKIPEISDDVSRHLWNVLEKLYNSVSVATLQYFLCIIHENKKCLQFIIIISLTSTFFQAYSRVWTAASQQH